MNVSIISTLVLMLSTSPDLARPIPVTEEVIKSYSDIAFIGRVDHVVGLGGYIEIEVRVVEKFFDRNEELSEVVIINASNPRWKEFNAGDVYFFSVSSCSNKAYVLLGEQFAAKVTDDELDTKNWHGFEGSTKLSALRSILSSALPKDPLLAINVCQMLFGCHDRDAKSLEATP